MPPSRNEPPGRPPKPPSERRSPAARGKPESAGPPGLITRIERAARSIGVDLPTAPLREIRSATRGEKTSAATEAAGYLATDPKAQEAAGIIVVLVDADGEALERRDFGRRLRKR